MRKALRNNRILKHFNIASLCLILANFYANPLYATLAKDMERYFANAGTFINATAPQAWKDQASGGFTGGGVFIRPQSRYVQPLTVTPPSLSMGCGIDFYSGGLGYMQSKEVIRTMRQIGSDMPYFGAQLMIATVSPEINNVIKYIQAFAQRINELGVNQCDAARKLTAAVYPKQQHASEMACRWMGSDEGLVTDFIKAKHQCNQGGEQEKVLKSVASNPKYKNLLIGDYNLVCRVLKNSAIWDSYQGLAEFLMSLTGTIVNTIEQGVATSRLKDSLLDQGDSAGLLKQILYGSEEAKSAKVYKCLDDECLKMGVTDARIPREQSFMGKISKIVTTLQEKHMADEGALTDAEKAILETTSVPLLKILTINSIRKTELVTLDEATLETIAKDFLMHYLDELIGLVEKELAHFRGVQFSSEDMDRLRDNIRAVKQILRTLETRFF